jgi:hypothetical protein
MQYVALIIVQVNDPQPCRISSNESKPRRHGDVSNQSGKRDLSDIPRLSWIRNIDNEHCGSATDKRVGTRNDDRFGWTIGPSNMSLIFLPGVKTMPGSGGNIRICRMECQSMSPGTHEATCYGPSCDLFIKRKLKNLRRDMVILS